MGTRIFQVTSVAHILLLLYGTGLWNLLRCFPILTASGDGRVGVEGLSKKEKRLMDVDNSVVIAGGGEFKGTKW